MESMSDEFRAWIRRVDLHAENFGYQAAYVSRTGGVDSWRVYFSQGYSPEKAFHEDSQLV